VKIKGAEGRGEHEPWVRTELEEPGGAGGGAELSHDHREGSAQLHCRLRACTIAVTFSHSITPNRHRLSCYPSGESGATPACVYSPPTWPRVCTLTCGRTIRQKQRPLITKSRTSSYLSFEENWAHRYRLAFTLRDTLPLCEQKQRSYSTIKHPRACYSGADLLQPLSTHMPRPSPDAPTGERIDRTRTLSK
jgi:hypothetical protein